MDILTRESLRKAGELLMRSADVSPKQEFDKFSLARAIVGMSRESLPGYEREVLEEFARREGQHFDKQRITLPFSLFRDLSKGIASAGGYLVSAETQDAVDILRPFSVSARAGITVETGLQGDQVIPKETAKSTPAWQSTEISTVTASSPTLGQIACTPHQVGIVVNFSRQLSLQANAEAFVRRELMNTVSTAIDQAVLNGSGASGQPLGLLLTTGINTETGTSLAQAGVVSMKRKVADANAPDEYIAYISTPSIRELLEKRERSTGSGFIWDDDKVAGRPGYVTTDMPASTLICGAWPLIWLGIWGGGFIIEVNPYDSSGFKIGQIQARILVSLDVAVLHPAAFCKSESIT